MMKLSIAFYLFIFNFVAFGYEHEFVVTDVVGDSGIQIQRLDKQVELRPGDILAIYSHESQQVLGYARVSGITDNSDLFIAAVETHNKSGIVRPENYLRKIDLTKLRNDIPARYDLTYKDENKAAAKYRPLVYAGVVQGMTAANLNKKEFLAGPSILSYGVTNWLQVDVNLASTLFGVTNFAIKNKLFENEDVQMSVENGFQYYKDPSKGSYQFTGYLDTNSNSNFKSYAKFKFFTQKPEDESLNNSDEYKKDFNLELSFSYGYMFANWNQLIFGPKVDVNKKRVGGNIGYYIIDKNFNTMFGVSSVDFSEFRLGRQGYLINLDFWWRF